MAAMVAEGRVYDVDEQGFPLSEQHWRVLGYLRGAFDSCGSVPTVLQTCEANDLELEELEALFPTGYHRGAVKIAGLKAR